TLVSGVRGLFALASGLSSPVTDKRQLTHQNHRGSVSPASSSPHRGVDPVCPRTTPTRAEGGRYLHRFVRQAIGGPGEVRWCLSSAKTQQSRNIYKPLLFQEKLYFIRFSHFITTSCLVL